MSWRSSRTRRLLLGTIIVLVVLWLTPLDLPLWQSNAGEAPSERLLRLLTQQMADIAPKRSKTPESAFQPTTTHSGQDQGAQWVDHQINVSPPEDSTPSQSKSELVSLPGPSAAFQITLEDMEKPSLSMSNPTASKSFSPEPLTREYVQIIMDPLDPRLKELECPHHIGRRYTALRANLDEESRIQYFVALNLYEVVTLLPRLLGTIVQVVKFLGPSKCAISIVEGPSNDNTYQVLAEIQTEMEKLGTTFFLQQNAINQDDTKDRIVAMARLRNLALMPMMEDAKLYASDALIIFSNDVAICPEDILELVYQHRFQHATMTCAFDWVSDGKCLYDSWIARSMSGDLFFEMPPSTWSDQFADDLFWDHPVSRSKYSRGQPIQVYSCWNGIVTMEGKPFMEGLLAFRPSRPWECYSGEPVNLAKDMWQNGIGRIAVIPSVNVGYSNNDSARAKERRGYVSDHVDVEKASNESQVERIIWQAPPPMVKCILPGWTGQYWVGPI